MADVDLETVADELYALLPDEFTAARDLRARELRLTDRELSAAVKALKRPSPSAWLVNQFARHRRDDLESVIELGAEMRAAQDGLDARELTRLASERRKLVAALARNAGELADELSAPVRASVVDDVAETLQAAMSDAQAADAVQSGRLLRSLEAVGTEVDLDGAVAGGGAPGSENGASGAKRAASARSTGGKSKTPTTRDEVAAQRERKAAQARERVEREADEATRAADEADDDLAEVERRVAETAKRIEARSVERDELESKLDAIESELAEAQREQRTVTRERDRAARYAASAHEAAEAARARLADLD